MKAITVEPHQPETARLEDIPEPDAHAGSILVEAIAVGVCGTDVEIVDGKTGRVVTHGVSPAAEAVHKLSSASAR